MNIETSWFPTIEITYYGNNYRARVLKAKRTTIEVEFATQGDKRERTSRQRDVCLGKHWTPTASQLDEIARRIGCFDNYFELLNSAGNYRPTIYPDTFKGNEVFARALCCAYDRDQANRNDPRRIYPERGYWDLAPGRRT